MASCAALVTSYIPLTRQLRRRSRGECLVSGRRVTLTARADAAPEKLQGGEASSPNKPAGGQYRRLYAKQVSPSDGAQPPATSPVEAELITEPMTLEEIRAEFPALGTEWAMLENAGGSQVPACVAEAVKDYMLNSYVQLGAGYPQSDTATETVLRAHAVVKTLMGGDGAGEVVLGHSTSALCAMLAQCFDAIVQEGDEIVLHRCGHESNINPWVRLAERKGAVVRWWDVSEDGASANVEALRRVLSPRTKVVAMCHVSNLLGEIADVAAVTAAARDVGARVVCDGVAYAPHRAVDVAAWGCDFYLFSPYKVYGPHVGAMFGTHDAFAELAPHGPNHFFVPADDYSYKFELGGVSHEACAGLCALPPYLRRLAGRAEPVGAGAPPLSRADVLAAFDVIADLEDPVQEKLMRYLAGKHAEGAIRVIGPLTADRAARVPTVSFVPVRSAGKAEFSTGDVVAAAHAARVAIRDGNMYAVRLCERLGIDPAEGVVRVSAVHYNTVEEIDRLVDALDSVL